MKIKSIVWKTKENIYGYPSLIGRVGKLAIFFIYRRIDCSREEPLKYRLQCSMLTKIWNFSTESIAQVQAEKLFGLIIDELIEK
jgi:hypothetical protein